MSLLRQHKWTDEIWLSATWNFQPINWSINKYNALGLWVWISLAHDKSGYEFKSLLECLKNQNHICSVWMMMMPLFCCTASLVGFPWKPGTSFYYRTNQPRREYIYINIRKSTVLTKEEQAVVNKFSWHSDLKQHSFILTYSKSQMNMWHFIW